MIDSPIDAYGTWAQHVTEWRANPYNCDFLIVRYEDLLMDGVRELNRISEFIGLDSSTNDLSEIVDSNKFSRLKSREKRFGLGHEAWAADEQFFRRGISGSYKDEMPEEVVDKFNFENAALLQELGYDC